MQLQRRYQLQAGESWLSEKNQSRTAQMIDKAKQYLSLTIVYGAVNGIVNIGSDPAGITVEVVPIRLRC